MPTFATISDLRDTSTFCKTVSASSEPIQVMKGRERKMVVMSSEMFERFEQMEKQAFFEAKIHEAEADTEAGRMRPMQSIQQSMRAKYDL